MHVGLEIEPFDVLDLEQVGALALDDQLVAGLQLEIGQLLLAAHRLLAADQLHDLEPASPSILASLSDLADQRAVLGDHHIGLIVALADLLLGLLVLALRDQADADRQT